VFWVIFVSVAVIVGVALILVQRQPVERDMLGADASARQGYRYEQFRPLGEQEQVLFWRLVEALPECVVLAHVPFARFMRPPEAGEKLAIRHYRTMYARIAQKKVDFLVCLRDFTVVATVDLDDVSQKARRDPMRDELLKSAGIVPLRVFSEAIPSVEALREMFTAPRP
jgi:hypothetical protein